MKTFTMTDEQFKKLLEASKPVRCMMIGGYTPRSPQENANAAWRELGEELGFDWKTVRPYGSDPKTFIAKPAKNKVEKEILFRKFAL